MEKIITVYIDGRGSEDFGPNLQEAIAYWDSVSFQERIVGSISIREFDSEGNCVRHGDILHVDSDGHVYLNTTITA
jgi:hypothetical protein